MPHPVWQAIEACWAQEPDCRPTITLVKDTLKALLCGGNQSSFVYQSATLSLLQRPPPDKAAPFTFDLERKRDELVEGEDAPLGYQRLAKRSVRTGSSAALRPSPHPPPHLSPTLLARISQLNVSETFPIADNVAQKDSNRLVFAKKKRVIAKTGAHRLLHVMFPLTLPLHLCFQ
jgi:hypothetical protein